MAVSYSRKIVKLLQFLKQNDLANEAIKLANEIDEGIKKYGIITIDGNKMCKFPNLEILNEFSCL